MVKTILGNSLEVLKDFADNSVDSIVTDPPYGISFMNKHWDYDVPEQALWEECLRVLKPGGHLLSFAGTRTQHRMAVRIEDAGFEIRDMIAWVYGSGFPKSHNLKDEWQGWGTALKPALEPITVARKPFKGTVAANVLEHGTGGLNIDGCRVGTEIVEKGNAGRGTAHNDGTYKLGFGISAERQTSEGRWPANLIHDGSEEVLAMFPDSNGSGKARVLNRSAKPEQDGWGMNKNAPDQVKLPGAGTGSASRFFYCAKASKRDRDDGNNHPTVKPTDLMRYLCRLVTPPNGTVLDPFMGSGSTGKAAILEGFNFIGIELNPEYIDIANARINAVKSIWD